MFLLLLDGREYIAVEFVDSGEDRELPDAGPSGVLIGFHPWIGTALGASSPRFLAILAIGFRGAGLAGINRSADRSTPLPPFKFLVLYIGVAPSSSFHDRRCHEVFNLGTVA